MSKPTTSKILSLLVAVAMIFTMMPLTAAAEGEVCTHEHGADCAYIEGADCGHMHDDSCGEDGEDCTHDHDEDCGYIEAVDCDHQHDEDCGGLSLGDSGKIIVAAFDALPIETRFQTYGAGELASGGDLLLPDTLNGTDAEDNAISIEGVTWQSKPAFDPAAEAAYIFTAALPEGYALAEGVTAPMITVIISSGGVGIQPLAATGELRIGGAVVVSDLNNSGSGTGWTWTANTNTLTLDSTYTGAGINIVCGLGDSINLVYSGSVTIQDGSLSCNGSLTISENGSGGTLTCKNSSGCGILADMNLTIASGTVVAESSGGQAGLAAGNGDITISGNANVTALTNASNGIEMPSTGTISINTSGTVTVTGNVIGNLDVSGGTVTVNGNISGDLDVSGGTVDITGTVTGTTDITGGDVTAPNVTTITSIAPNHGFQAGGDPVVLTGTNLAGATAVTVDGNTAIITENTATQIKFTTPAGTAGAKDVVVTTPGGTATLTGGFTYLAESKTVSVGAQSGSLTAGTPGSVTYNVTTANIADGKTITLNTSVAGISMNTASTTNNSATITVNTTASTPAGNHTLTVTVDDVTSPSFNLAVGAAPQYAINVTNGTANPNPAVSGATVTLTANSPASGKQFKQWDITPAVTFTDSTSATSSTAKFTMPAQTVAATAIYENIPSTVTGVTVNPSSVTVQKGTSYQFSATVTGTNNPAQTVTWSVSGGTSSSTIDTDGTLNVHSSETNGTTLTVTATSTANISISGTATVTVSDTAPSTPTVTSVTVTPAAITLDKGDSHTFSAAVTGTNSPSQGVTWSVSPNTNGSSINTSGTLIVGTSETAGVLTVRATSTVAPTISGTATVTVNQPVQPITYTITFNPNGGAVGETTRAITQGAAIGALPIPTRSGNYRFDGWFTAASGGTVISAATIPTGNTTYYAQWTYTGSNNNGGGSSSDSGSGSGGGGITSTTTAPATTWLDQNAAATLASGAKNRGENYVRTRSTGAYGVRGNAWTKLTGLQYQHDTVADGAVQVRLYINDPSKLTADSLVSGSVKGAEADKIKAFFEKWFRNKLRMIHLDRQGDFGQPVQIAARVDLTGMDTKKLVFYAYDKKTNSYKRIEKPAYWIDANGYLHFTTELAGDIVISEGALTKK